MQRTIKTDQELINILKLSRVDRIICDTDKGVLKLCLRKGENNYFFTLDAQELGKNVNKELMELLYPLRTEPSIMTPLTTGASLKVEVVPQTDYPRESSLSRDMTKLIKESFKPIKNPRGRPKKVK